MQLEFHQLDRRWAHLRVRHPARQRRLLASLADSGQQTPIVVVAAEGQADRYVVIDGYKRILALEQLGRDTVEAVVWPMSEAAAVLLDRSLRLSEHETMATIVDGPRAREIWCHPLRAKDLPCSAKAWSLRTVYTDQRDSPPPPAPEVVAATDHPSLEREPAHGP